jgi:NitT/TauT family transport system substrate-binding protein
MSNWNRRDFVKNLGGLAGVGWLSSYIRSANAEAPPETDRITIDAYPITCIAPQYVAEALLKAEGFTDLRYARLSTTTANRVSTGEIDMDLNAVGPLITSIDNGDPVLMLAGVHLGCYELFANERVRAVKDLKGKRIPIDSLRGPQHVLLSSMAAYVGLDPRKDIDWVIATSSDGMKLFETGQVDAYMGFPPEPQELKAKKVGRVIVNTAVDKPWSEYYCCMLNANRDFVQRHPVATKRAARAILKAADLCARQPELAAQMLVDKKFAKRYDFALETLKEVRYDAWRTYDPNNTIRFHALRLHEVGMIKSTPNDIIARGTDWRFLNELKKELKA